MAKFRLLAFVLALLIPAVSIFVHAESDVEGIASA